MLGALIDRIGGRKTLAFSLLTMAIGYGLYPFVTEPWQAFGAAAIAGVGNGGFWPSQSSLIAGLTPPDKRHTAFATQRVMMNLGIGLGGLAGGLIASAESPGTFQTLFLLDAFTFLVFVGALAFVPTRRATRPTGTRGGRGAIATCSATASSSACSPSTSSSSSPEWRSSRRSRPTRRTSPA